MSVAFALARQHVTQGIAFQRPDLLLSVFTGDVLAHGLVEVFRAGAGAFTHHVKAVFQRKAAHGDCGAFEDVVGLGLDLRFDVCGRDAGAFGQALGLDVGFDGWHSSGCVWWLEAHSFGPVALMQ